MKWSDQKKCIVCDNPLTKWTTDHNYSVYDCLSSGGNCVCQLICCPDNNIVGYCVRIIYNNKSYVLSGREGIKQTLFGGELSNICNIDYVELFPGEDIKSKVITLIKRLANMKTFT